MQQVDEEKTPVNLPIRAQLMISRALSVAIKTLSKEENPPTSDISDMEYMLEVMFPLWKAVELSDSMREDLLKINELGLTTTPEDS